MAEATAGPDAELVVEVTVLAQDAVERVVRDHVARGRRTGARTAAREESLREVDVRPQDQQG
ncbi:DUF2191 domain-containing protein [Streptomyces atratus]|uniref:DUF2191 domain-containing protein n=1 Tax=Streptomyces atratus TaxID=1893 RepID=A0A2Z5JLJ9_STRAR|nr:DUF2191 domain-containing protein [Streptomyces atratus]AXE81183.1 DUF2191 domain-containing protein [Streptomyces atratus]WPW33701.1 DUF2191 domain-containing protein [Streptomyces atratus]